jgi:hypothetical protein
VACHCSISGGARPIGRSGSDFLPMRMEAPCSTVPGGSIQGSAPIRSFPVGGVEDESGLGMGGEDCHKRPWEGAEGSGLEGGVPCLEFRRMPSVAVGVASGTGEAALMLVLAVDTLVLLTWQPVVQSGRHVRVRAAQPPEVRGCAAA